MVTGPRGLTSDDGLTSPTLASLGVGVTDKDTDSVSDGDRDPSRWSPESPLSPSLMDDDRRMIL